MSLTGTRLSMIAIPLLRPDDHRHGALTGLVAFAEMLPLVLLKALWPARHRPGGRSPRRHRGDLGSVVVVGLIPLLHDAGC